MSRLPNDVARCPGSESDEGDLREGCEDCMRRTALFSGPTQPWMTPPALVVFECEARIAPRREAPCGRE